MRARDGFRLGAGAKNDDMMDTISGLVASPLYLTDETLITGHCGQQTVVDGSFQGDAG